MFEIGDRVIVKSSWANHGMQWEGKINSFQIHDTVCVLLLPTKSSLGLDWRSATIPLNHIKHKNPITYLKRRHNL